MTARIKISQVGLPAGVAGVARTDGLANGALVTLEDVSGAGNSSFHLLWGPPEDTTAEASLAPTGDPDIWTFAPTAASYGSYLIELRELGVPVERRIFGIRTPAQHLLIPALNERASRHAAWDNDGADQIDASNNNAVDFPTSNLNAYPYAGWWRSLRELYAIVEAGTGGIADHSIALVKLALAPSKGVIANPTAIAGDAQYLVGTAAFDYLRVNAANTGLEWASLAAQGSTSILYDAGTNTFIRAAVTGAVTAAQNSNTSTFGAAAGKSVLANATNGSAVPAFLAGTAAFQHLRVNSSNTGLEWATLSSHASTSILYTSDQFQRAALSGAITSAQNTNTTAFGNAAARSQLANLTNASAVPAFTTAPGPLFSLRSNVNNDALEWAGGGAGTQLTAATVSALTTVLSTTATITIPANTLVAGAKYRCTYAYRFVRGGTATALNLGSFFDVATAPSTAIPAQTAAGTYELRVEAEMTILTTGAGGTAMVWLSTYGTASTVAGSISTISNLAMPIDTTIAIAMRGAAQMNTAVAGTSITALGGHIERIN